MSLQSQVFKVGGMHCTACSARLEKRLNNRESVHASVNFASGTALVRFDDKKVSLDTLIDEAQKTGFSLELNTKKSSFRKGLLPDIINLALSWAGTLLLMGGMIWGHHTNPWYHFTVAAFVVFIPGRGILQSALASTMAGAMGMDVLIALGALVALGSSFFTLLGFTLPDYSMTAAMLIAVNLLGRFLETLARGRASEAVTALANFGSKTVLKRTAEGELIEIPIDDLDVGDIVEVRAGDNVPADGTVLTGRSSTDESFLTGESLPVEKGPGSLVYAGSVNIEGLMTVTVGKRAEHSFLAQTVELMQETQGTKIPIQILADKITTIFVPIILTLAFLAAAVWAAFPDFFPSLMAFWGIEFNDAGRFNNAVSVGIAVLVIACPCALGLATPMALVNGSALGAKKGILIRRGAAAQVLSEASVIALDKTGTITEGHPQMKEFFPESLDKEQALALMAGLEEFSSHPLAHCIVSYAKDLDILPLKIENSVIKFGQGIEGTWDDRQWFAGSLKACEELGVTFSHQQLTDIEQILGRGESLVCLVDLNENKCAAIASFADNIKADSFEAIAALKEMGLRVVMITGDHRKAAEHIAGQLGINNIIYEASPKQKLENIQSIQDQGYKVVFVGDGINDAAALEASDVGIALGTGTDIANEAGDIILVSGSLKGIVSAIKLSKAILNKVKQNLFWAFFYNFVAIPIAFMGFLHPIAAEVAMSFSSLTVIGNSILLSRKKIS